MRVILDLQAAQEHCRTDFGRWWLSLARMLIRDGRHEFFLLVNSAIPAGLEHCLVALEDSLPAEQILRFYPVVADVEKKSGRDWTAEAASKIILLNLVAGVRPDVVFSSGSFTRHHASLPVPDDPRWALAMTWNHPELWSRTDDPNHHERLRHLRGTALCQQADVLVTHSVENQTQVVHELQIDPGRVCCASATGAVAASEALECAVRYKEQKWSPRYAHPKSPGKPRLAYVSPLPPQATGIADYSAEILPALSEHYDIDVITPEPGTSNEWIAANCALRHPVWFDKHADHYQRILYHVGNNGQAHGHMLDLLVKHPGVVALHDVFLSNMLQNLENVYPGCSVFTQETWRSHGWEAFAAMPDASERAENLPCSGFIFDHANAVIVHSSTAVKIISRYFPHQPAPAFVPLARRLRSLRTRTEARARLGIPPDAFVCASFGFVQPYKLAHRLASAWALVEKTHPSARLVFVGSDHYPGGFQPLLAGLPNATLTGRMEDADYASYLAAADCAVQLRTASRGEATASMLDTLAAGIPTIANAHGALAEFPPDIHIRISDNFEDEELAAAICRLIEDDAMASELGARARAHVATNHNPVRCMRSYAEIIEHAYEGGVSMQVADTVQEVRALLRSSRDGQSHKLEASRAIARTFDTPRDRRRVICDISYFAQHDTGTGIHRVIRRMLDELLRRPWDGFRTEPSATTANHELSVPLDYMRKRFGLNMNGWPHEGILPRSSDIFLQFDLLVSQDVKQLWEKSLRHMAEAHFVIHDILPIERSDCYPAGFEPAFKEWLESVAAYADGVICISRTVADQVLAYLRNTHGVRRNRVRPLKVGWFHLGADYRPQTSAAGDSLPHDITQALSRAPTFLMVSTIEPRKGYAQALKAFEMLWEKGVEANLAIVGKRGWNLEALWTAMEQHPAKNRRLFWFEGASDDVLEALYSQCACVLVASEGEGFGLPLIEAAQHEKPLLCRDIPVFREVAGDHATYFHGTSPADLANAIEHWLLQSREGQVPTTNGLRYLSWAESAEQLRNVVLGGQWYGEWAPA